MLGGGRGENTNSSVTSDSPLSGELVMPLGENKVVSREQDQTEAGKLLRRLRSIQISLAP